MSVIDCAQISKKSLLMPLHGFDAYVDGSNYCQCMTYCVCPTQCSII